MNTHFFSVLSTEGIEGNEVEEGRSGLTVVFWPQLLSLARFTLFRTLVLECDRAKYVYPLACSPGGDAFDFTECVSALQKENRQEFQLTKE